MKWRLITLKNCNLYTLHATEDYFLEEVNKKNQKPTIILSNLKSPSISISYKQNLKKDVNLTEAKKTNIDITRRKTGGRSIYLDDKHYIVSIIDKKSPHMIDPTLNYKKICNKIIHTIKNLTGITLQLENKNDLITTTGKKIGGAAQKIKSHSYLVHCYIRHQTDLNTMLNLITIDDTSLKPYKKEFSEFTGSIMSESQNPQNNFYTHFKENLLEKITQNQFENTQLSETEKTKIETIAKTYKEVSYIQGTGNEPSRGNCDLIAGKTLKIKDLEGKVNYI